MLDLLTTEREAALAESTRLRNQLHALLLQVEPEYRAHFTNLRSRAALNKLETYAPPGNGPEHAHRIAAVLRLTKRLRLALSQVDELAREIEAYATEFAPLTRLCGVNLLTAGAAPLEASSAGSSATA